MKPITRALLGGIAGLALCLTIAGPASADDITSFDPADAPPALQEWLGDAPVVPGAICDSGTTTTAAPAVSATPQVGTPGGTVCPAGKKVLGARLTHTRGGALLWTRNGFEWYYTSSKVTSSSGYQEVGYVFPNTARKGGVTRTLKATTHHAWRGTNIVGAGVVTPWGDVNVYQSSKTDYYDLRLNGRYTIN
jgi:hypothetical protein